jgi:hypothetical protein
VELIFFLGKAMSKIGMAKRYPDFFLKRLAALQILYRMKS